MKSNALRFLLLITLLMGTSIFCSSRAGEAQNLLATCDTSGGIMTLLGEDDPSVAIELAAQSGFLVHSLVTSDEQSRNGNALARKRQLAERVTFEKWRHGYLPYSDEIVNALVIAGTGTVPREEMLRVLTPAGVLLERNQEGWSKTVKPRPKEIDEWTHFLHAADGNPVAMDERVGPPRHIQWTAEPKWARAHEQLASISAIVTANGRIFYIADEAPVASIRLEPHWRLIARDAFNGRLLWKRDITDWVDHLRGFRSGPAHLPRRLVAQGDSVFVTLGYENAVARLDAGTGKMITLYGGTAKTEEIVCTDGVLYVVTGDPRGEEPSTGGKSLGAVGSKDLLALDVETAKLLWKQTARESGYILPLTVAVRNGQLYYHNLQHLVCLNSKNGRPIWKAPRRLTARRSAWSTPTLIATDKVVLSAERTPAPGTTAKKTGDKLEWLVSIQGGGMPGELIAYSARNGNKLWSAPCAETYNAPPDVFVANGLVWIGESARRSGPDFKKGRDLLTGEVKKEINTFGAFAETGMAHHRCYRNKATDNFIITGRSGVELIDLEDGKCEQNLWVRGTCAYGIMPANGFIYAPSHSCACYLKTKLNGFNALRTHITPHAVTPKSVDRYEQGKAFGFVPGTKDGPTTDWPTFRQNGARGGASSVKLTTDLGPAWSTPVGNHLTAPVVAGGQVLVAEREARTLHALDARTGQIRWSYSTGGRIDSPPTVYRDAVYLGSGDGWLYCLRASDGELAWRFRAAPQPRRVVVYEQLESAWPLHGTVLIQNGSVFCAAGRNSYLDGGIHLYRLDPTSGRILNQRVIYSRDDATGKTPSGKRFDTEGVLCEVLLGDGSGVYMKQMAFTEEFKDLEAPNPRLLTATTLLDGSWWHRSYWIHGTDLQVGWGGWWKLGNQMPSGRILCKQGSRLYGYGRTSYPGGNSGQWKGNEGYHLFRAPLPEPQPESLPAANRRRSPRQKPTHEQDWSVEVPIMVRAMAVSDGLLIAAGFPDAARPREGQPMQLENPDETLLAYQGRQGGKLIVFDAENGNKKYQAELTAPPVFDGLAISPDGAFLCTTDGQVTCFRGQSTP